MFVGFNWFWCCCLHTLNGWKCNLGSRSIHLLKEVNTNKFKRTQITFQRQTMLVWCWNSPFKLRTLLSIICFQLIRNGCQTLSLFGHFLYWRARNHANNHVWFWSIRFLELFHIKRLIKFVLNGKYEFSAYKNATFTKSSSLSSEQKKGGNNFIESILNFCFQIRKLSECLKWSKEPANREENETFDKLKAFDSEQLIDFWACDWKVVCLWINLPRYLILSPSEWIKNNVLNEFSSQRDFD